VDAVLLVLHLLAAAVWVGGTVALVFVGVPVVARLEGEMRSRSMRELGRRWRPIGYGALLVLGVTGVPLAANVAVGRAAFAFTIVVPVLGVALTELTNG
jgi:uncharacterized membrane protein